MQHAFFSLDAAVVALTSAAPRTSPRTARSAVSAPPVVEDAVVDVNCTEGLSIMTVYLLPPGYKGSGTAVPFAESGRIVRYFVAAVPTSGEEDDTIYVDGEGELQPDGTVRCRPPAPCSRLPRSPCCLGTPLA